MKSKILTIATLLTLFSIKVSDTFAATTDVFGTIEPPEGVDAYNKDPNAGGFGLMIFVSNVMKLATLAAGLWTLFNIVLAGYTYITSSGDSSAHGKVKDKITMSVLGIVIIVAAYTIAGIIGLVFFGRADYILNPVIYGPI